MTLDELRDEIWRNSGEDSDLDPDSDVSLNGGPLLTWVCNEAQRQIATYKDPILRKRVRFRNLISELYFKSKVITGTLADSGAVATYNSIKLSSSYVGSQSGRYDGWICSCGSDRRMLVDYNALSSSVHASWGTLPSNGDAFSLYKNFYHFLPSTDSFMAAPSGEHITLPSTSAGNSRRPVGNFLEVLKIEQLKDKYVIPRGHRTESWVGYMDSPGDPAEWMRDGNKLVFDCPTAEEMWFRLKYYRLPADMASATDEPEIPEMFQYGIILWGLQWAFSRSMEPSRKYSAKRDFEDFMRQRLTAYEVENDLEESYGTLRRDDY